MYIFIHVETQQQKGIHTPDREKKERYRAVTPTIITLSSSTGKPKHKALKCIVLFSETVPHKLGTRACLPPPSRYPACAFICEHTDPTFICHESHRHNWGVPGTAVLAWVKPHFYLLLTAVLRPSASSAEASCLYPAWIAARDSRIHSSFSS